MCNCIYVFQAQCTSILETISHQVNSQHSELAAHRLLSIFKMAEVQIVWPEVSKGSPTCVRAPISFPLMLVFVFILFPVVRWWAWSSFQLNLVHSAIRTGHWHWPNGFGVKMRVWVVVKKKCKLKNIKLKRRRWRNERKI